MRALHFAAALVAAASLFAGLPSLASDIEPVRLARTAQYDVKSKLNGETYRVMVALPPGHDKANAYPVLYVLEGNVYFAAAADALTRQAFFKNASPAIVVGIGYPSDEMEVGLTRRWQDLTPTHDPREKRRNGEGDIFLKILETEIKPFVAERYRVDTANQALWGHSIGGLMVMRAMMRNPTAYSSYLISSPSIWWDNSVILKDEPAFVAWLAQPGPPIRVLLSFGSRDSERMKKDGEALNSRLGTLRSERLKMQHLVFDDESHITVSHVSVVRGLRFAFPPAGPGTMER